MSNPLQILKTSIKSPLNLRVSSVVKFRMLGRSSYYLFFRFEIFLLLFVVSSVLNRYPSEDAVSRLEHIIQHGV
jgi:hypothetical protein